jgi:hypothetical protein
LVFFAYLRLGELFLINNYLHIFVLPADLDALFVALFLVEQALADFDALFVVEQFFTLHALADELFELLSLVFELQAFEVFVFEPINEHLPEGQFFLVDFAIFVSHSFFISNLIICCFMSNYAKS